MWTFVAFLVLSLEANSIFSSPSLRPDSPQCGYESCPSPKEGYINLHLVAHTHDDVGWLKTVDQYYYGSRPDIQKAGVQYILDSVIRELSHDPERKFIYVETAFFWKWWKEQDDATRGKVRELVSRGQLEFIGGAWSMNDEADTHYLSTIDQYTWGFRRLNDAFGKCGSPRVGWQIDPFGHSRENAAIMARLGFDGLFLGRIDWQDKNWRIFNRTMEMIWYTSSNDHSEASRLFTGVMFNVYWPPSGFCFDILCQDEPIIDNPNSTEYNAKRRVDDFLRQMDKYAKAYRTKNIIVTMGNDFHFQDAGVNFKNIDKLIKNINAIQGPDSPFHAFYSTPSCYLKAVHESGVAFPTKSDDFFPYSSDRHAFWTGYFTSRPTLKRFERMGNNYLQVSKQLFALAGTPTQERKHLIALQEAMGIMQHHDAITGTEKQAVADDYAKILYDAIRQCDEINTVALRKMTGTVEDSPDFQNCLLLNISSCPTTESSDQFVVTVYNPLSRAVSPQVRVPVSSSLAEYSIKSPNGHKKISQVHPLPAPVENIPGRNSPAKAELIFLSQNVPPLGFKSYHVSKKANWAAAKVRKFVPTRPTSLGYDGRFLNLDEHGILESVTIDGETEPFSISFGYYHGAGSGRASGAYIFRPEGSDPHIFNSLPNVTVVHGEVVSEVRYEFSDWVSSVLRVYKGVEPFHIEHEWLVGPIPLEMNRGKEVVVRYTFKNLENGVFWTDSNGREMLLRKLNYRPEWDLDLKEPIAGNYYPITTRIAIQDVNKMWSVVTDRAQGGSSLKKGTIELMVHRRCTRDDGFGVDEALDERAFGVGLVARGTHYIVPGSHAKARKAVQDKVLSAWPFFTPTEMSFKEWKRSYKMMLTGLRRNLDDRIQILTLEPWRDEDQSYLLRLENILEINDDPSRSNQSVVVDLNDLFAHWTVVNIQEMVLGANALKSEVRRLRWNEVPAGSLFEDPFAESKNSEPFSVSLKPMEIRTFIVKLDPLNGF